MAKSIQKRINGWSHGDALTFVPLDGNHVYNDYTVVRIDSTTFELHCGQFSVSNPASHNKTKGKKDLDYDIELNKSVDQLQQLLPKHTIKAGRTTYYYPHPEAKSRTVTYDDWFNTAVVEFPPFWSTLFGTSSFTARFGVDIIMSYEKDIAGVQLIKKIKYEAEQHEAYSDAEQQKQIRLSDSVWCQIDKLLDTTNNRERVFTFVDAQDGSDSICQDEKQNMMFKRSTLIDNITSQKTQTYNQYTSLYQNQPTNH